jgi:hypothetical protein
MKLNNEKTNKNLNSQEIRLFVDLFVFRYGQMHSKKILTRKHQEEI